MSGDRFHTRRDGQLNLTDYLIPRPCIDPACDRDHVSVVWTETIDEPNRPAAFNAYLGCYDGDNQPAVFMTHPLGADAVYACRVIPGELIR